MYNVGIKLWTSVGGVPVSWLLDMCQRVKRVPKWVYVPTRGVWNIWSQNVRDISPSDVVEKQRWIWSKNIYICFNSSLIASCSWAGGAFRCWVESDVWSCDQTLQMNGVTLRVHRSREKIRRKTCWFLIYHRGLIRDPISCWLSQRLRLLWPLISLHFGTFSAPNHLSVTEFLVPGGHRVREPSSS